MIGKLVVVAGNSGVGKTTVTRALAELGGFATGLEQHGERPFQALMKQDPRRYGLANQIDYLLHRAEQERALRERDQIGLVDGGLDLDYYGFTHLFRHKGYLTEAEFALCGRLYRQLRTGLGEPDLILWLIAPSDVIENRYQRRGRPLEIAAREDLNLLGRFIGAWLDKVPPEKVMVVDGSSAETLDGPALESLWTTIEAHLVR